MRYPLFFVLFLASHQMIGQTSYAWVKRDTVIRDSLKILSGEIFPLIEDGRMLFGPDTLFFPASFYDTLSGDSLFKFTYVENIAVLHSQDIGRFLKKRAEDQYTRVVISNYPSLFLYTLDSAPQFSEEKASSIEASPERLNLSYLDLILLGVITFILGFGLSYLLRKKPSPESGNAPKIPVDLQQSSKEVKSGKSGKANPAGVPKKDPPSLVFREGKAAGIQWEKIMSSVQSALDMLKGIKEGAAGTTQSTYFEAFLEDFDLPGYQKRFEKWHWAATSLANKGKVEDPYLVDAINGAQDQTEKLRNLKKVFYYEYIKPVIPSVFTLLEEFKNIKLFVPNPDSISNESVQQLDSVIEDLLKNLKQDFDISLVYVPLFSNLQDAPRHTTATDAFDTIPDHYRHLFDKAKEKTGRTIVEIVSYGMESEFEQKDTIVKVTG